MFGCTVRRCFIYPQHGKGPVNAAGIEAKRLLDQLMLQVGGGVGHAGWLVSQSCSIFGACCLYCSARKPTTCLHAPDASCALQDNADMEATNVEQLVDAPTSTAASWQGRSMCGGAGSCSSCRPRPATPRHSSGGARRGGAASVQHPGRQQQLLKFQR
jgi:hypothetical protein